MNPEAGFAPAEGMTETPPREVAELLLITNQDIRDLVSEDLQRLHDELVPQLGKPEKPSTGFAGYVEHLPPPLQQRVRKNPAVATEHLRTYLETGLQTLRTREKHKAEQAVVGEVRREMTGAEKRFAQQAELVVERNFSAWNASRLVVDREGRPGHLYPEDQAHVDMIDAKRDIARAKGEEFFELTDRFEVGFAQGLNHFEVFGDQVEVVVHPSSKYDDYARGVDMIAQIQLSDEAKTEIILGIDFTISSTKEQLAEKLLRNKSQPLRRTKYATAAVPNNLKYLPVVLAVDRRRAERISKHEAMVQVTAEVRGGEAMMAESTADLERYHDEAVFKYAVLEEVIAQLHVQREVLEDRGVNDSSVTDYQTAIDYFEGVLADRKNLQSMAGVEKKRDEGVFLVADEAFIRSASARRVGGAASPAL